MTNRYHVIITLSITENGCLLPLRAPFSSLRAKRGNLLRVQNYADDRLLRSVFITLPLARHVKLCYIIRRKMCYQCKLFLREIFIFSLAANAVIFNFNIPWFVVFLIAALPVFISFGTMSSVIGGIRIFVPTAVLSFFSLNPFAVYLPFLTWALLTLSIRSGKRWTLISTVLFNIAWICLSLRGEISLADGVFILSSIISLLFALPMLKGKTQELKDIDIMVKSTERYTLQAAETFADGAAEVLKKEKINIINWEERGIEPGTLKGGALVIAFKPKFFGCGRGFLIDMIKKLPRGNGKAAFILYTAFLYPDTAAFILWVVLRIKGYDVRGTLLKTTFNSSESNIISECGGDFADGWPCGEPLIISPSPLFLLGLLIK